MFKKCSDVASGGLETRDGIEILKQMIKSMKRGSVVVDVAIDQGGLSLIHISEPTRPY